MTSWQVEGRARTENPCPGRVAGSGAPFALTRRPASDDTTAMTRPHRSPIDRSALDRSARSPRGSFSVAVVAFAALVAFGAFGAVACSKEYIPNTDVEDTGVNRDIVGFCEKYRHAMEDRNVAQLLKLMSPAYFEEGGETQKESADYERIRDFLTGDFLKTGGVRYEMRYRRITFTENNHIYVDYTYAAAWKLPGVKTDEWHHKVADNRLDLVRDGESFKIVSGM
jgi:hypothetical protein